MLKIGLTGNIGSGKSLVAEIFRVCGVPIYTADKEAKRLMNLDGTIRRIQSVFGDEVVSGGAIDNKKLARIVFSDPKKLKLLNEIIHPLVHRDFDEWCHRNATSAFVLYEAAIIFESGYAKNLDAVILVTAPEELRIQRVMSRDGSNHDEVERRIRNQLDENIKREKADYIINNDGTEMLIPQVLDAISFVERLRQL